MPGSGEASKLDELETWLGTVFPSIRRARIGTQHKRSELAACFAGISSPDTSLVVFGSVAREGVTSGSDLDWVLLIDGQSEPEHKEQEREIERRLVSRGFIEPGSSGVFGKMVGSHDLVHNIGGEDDLNSNTTRRILLLLESHAVGNRDAYDRVRRQIVRRYLGDDRGLTHGESTVRIPRFLLNDLTRYWRTVTVDFVYKQRADDRKWALRNAKLRMSRKLIFSAGLAHVLFCHLDPAASGARSKLVETKDVSLLTAYLSQQLMNPPLETIAKLSLSRGVRKETASAIFENYDRFLGILDSPEKRGELEKARNHDELRESAAWREIREVSQPFHEGLVRLFLRDDEELTQLTMRYGLF